MKFFEGLRIAFRGLISNKMRSVLTMLGVIIGVGSVITLVSIGEGVRSSISSQIQGLGSNLVLVTGGKGAVGINASSMGAAVSELSYEDALAVEQNAETVENAAPLLESGVNVQYKGEKATLLSGTSESYSEVRNSPLALGKFFSRGDIRGYRHVAVIGNTVRRELFKKENPVGKKIKLHNTDFEVIGVMEKKGPTLTIDNDDRVFIPITVAEQLLDTKQVNMMFVQAVGPDEVGAAVADTKRIIGNRHKKNDFVVSEQKDILNTFQGIMGTLTGMLGGIAGVSLIVGGIGIMNIMLVTVSERTREIGIRKAVGAKKRDIMFQFLLESIFISAIGGLIGIAAGFAGARLLDRVIPKMPTIISPWSITAAFVFALAVGLFFGIYPAKKAARMDPIEALRYE